MCEGGAIDQNSWSTLGLNVRMYIPAYVANHTLLCPSTQGLPIQSNTSDCGVVVCKVSMYNVSTTYINFSFTIIIDHAVCRTGCSYGRSNKNELPCT